MAWDRLISAGQKDPSIMFLTVRLFTAPPGKVGVEPCFVVAALIGRADAKSFPGNGECAVKPNFPVPVRFRCFKESLAWNRSKSHNGVGPGGFGKAKASSMVLMLFLLSHRHAAQLKSQSPSPPFRQASLHES